MKLLVFTQKVDKNDSLLGFFHDWIIKISGRCESVEVVCLQKGEYDLPKNVKVYSLGKEDGPSRIKYIFLFYKYLFKLRGSYDKVFVHVNHEYILLGGLYWRIRNVPVYFWREQIKNGFLTFLAVFLSSRVFCNSINSFTTKFKKIKIMPWGNNTDVFHPMVGVVRKKYSVCMLGDTMSKKDVYLGLEAINILVKSGVQVSLNIIGGFVVEDENFYQDLLDFVENNKLKSLVTFQREADFKEYPSLFSTHEIYLKLSPGESFEKTIFEATSCGAIPIVSSRSFSGLLPDICITDKNVDNIASSIKRLLDPTEQIKIQKDLDRFVESNSLKNLINKLFEEIK